MQYHLETIPIWEAMEWKCECPLCALERKTELEEIERTLGPGVMEPDVRIQFNKIGVCRKHQRMLYAQQNRLSHALLTDSLVKKRMESLTRLRQRLQADKRVKPGLFSKTTAVEAAVAKLRQMNAHCVVCDAVAAHMARYRYTFLQLWKTDERFRALWKESKGACLPHTLALMESGRDFLSAAKQRAFADEALGLLMEQLACDEADVEQFTRKFDYLHKEEPWGESKTAAERAVNRLRGWCLGAEPGSKKK
jgi:hypothetical protein